MTGFSAESSASVKIAALLTKGPQQKGRQLWCLVLDLEEPLIITDQSSDLSMEIGEYQCVITEVAEAARNTIFLQE